MEITLFDIAQRFIGTREVPGSEDNPAIMAMLKLDDEWPKNDETPWCSAFMNYCAWLLRLPRSKSLRARSWLLVGWWVEPEHAKVGFDVCIFKRGGGKQPGPSVIDAPGHVALYAGRDGNKIYVLGGNQGDSVSVSSYPASRLLGIRRIG